jgi:tRNA (guanine-N7-)-methyltransferase
MQALSNTPPPAPAPLSPEAYGPPEPGELFPDWTARFGARPLHCEIGFGRGHFAADFAAQNDVGYVALEIRRSDCDLLRERVAHRGLANVHVLQGDAMVLLARLFRPGQLDALHIHCPDPWWKARHHRRRLFADDFALLLYALLRPGGELDLRTDVDAYARSMIETCEGIVGFENALGPGRERGPEGLVLSSRERRYAETGQPVHRFLYLRPDRPPRSTDTGGAWLRRNWIDRRRK